MFSAFSSQQYSRSFFFPPNCSWDGIKFSRTYLKLRFKVMKRENMSSY